MGRHASTEKSIAGRGINDSFCYISSKTITKKKFEHKKTKRNLEDFYFHNSFRNKKHLIHTFK